MIKGELTVEVEEERVILRAGDSYHFDSTKTHCTWNHRTEVATLLWCGTMDVFGTVKSNPPIRNLRSCRRTARCLLCLTSEFQQHFRRNKHEVREITYGVRRGLWPRLRRLGQSALAQDKQVAYLSASSANTWLGASVVEMQKVADCQRHQNGRV